MQGAADLQSPRRGIHQREWRGTFVFHQEDRLQVAALVDARGPVVYEAHFEGERKKLVVEVTGMSPLGLAFIEGYGEPY